MFDVAARKAVPEDVKRFIGKTVKFYGKYVSSSITRNKEGKVLEETATYLCTTSDGVSDQKPAAFMIDAHGVKVGMGQTEVLIVRGTVDRSESTGLQINHGATTLTAPFLVKASVEGAAEQK